MTKTKTKTSGDYIIIPILLSILLSIIFFTNPVGAESYSITQNSKYAYSTDNTLLNQLEIHHDLSPWSDPDLSNLKEKMNAKRWVMKFHVKNEEVKLNHFTDLADKSDIHFHAGHGFNIPLGYGGHLELFNHPYPTGVVNAKTVEGKWKNCKWFPIHACHVLEDTDWANVLKGSNSHGILGFGSIAYTTGNFLSEYGEKITNGWTLAKAWEKTSYDQFKDTKEKVVVRTIFKNFDQYLYDKLDAPSTNNTEDIVMCDTPVKVNEEKDIVTFCKCMKSGKEYKIEKGTVKEKVIIIENKKKRISTNPHFLRR